MKHFKVVVLVVLASMMLNSCGFIAAYKRTKNHAKYIDITGKTGTLTINKITGDVVVENARIMYVGIESGDLFYTIPDDDLMHYTDNSVQFDFRR